MEKILLTGNEALARGAKDAGVTVGTAYPGTPSTEILENFALYPGVYCNWSSNEKTALETAIGASLGGARVMAAMKHVGVNVAADPLMTLSYTGVGAGLVLISADDPGMHSSQNEQDNRHYARFAKVPMLEPSSSQEAYDYIRAALELSEKYDTPVMLRSTTRISHSRGMVAVAPPVARKQTAFIKNEAKYVMLPGYARMRHPIVEQRLQELQAESENSSLNYIDGGSTDIGIICSGIAFQYVKEAMPEASVLKLGFSYPFPDGLIRKFAGMVKKLYVVEELDPFIEEHLKSLGIKAIGKELFPLTGELGAGIIREKITGRKTELLPVEGEIPGRPPVLCPGCSHRGVFHILKKLKLNVMGDIGCYTLSALPPLKTMDACVCMGASIGLALGMEKADPAAARSTVAVIGDSTFIHSGITPLMDVVYSRGKTTVLILDNRTTGMTGHQDHPGTGVTLQKEVTKAVDLEALCRSIGVERVTVADPFNLEELYNIVSAEIEADEPSVIIARHPCILKSGKTPRPLVVNDDICNGCRTCLKLGCPAISLHDKTAVINTPICTGCTLCKQLCPRNAIFVAD